MVVVAQSEECLVVTQEVVRSKLTNHPTKKNAKGGAQKNLCKPLSVIVFFENFVAKNIYNMRQNYMIK
jgi:hypothetical protein